MTDEEIKKIVLDYIKSVYLNQNGYFVNGKLANNAPIWKAVKHAEANYNEPEFKILFNLLKKRIKIN